MMVASGPNSSLFDFHYMTMAASYRPPLPQSKLASPEQMAACMSRKGKLLHISRQSMMMIS